MNPSFQEWDLIQNFKASSHDGVNTYLFPGESWEDLAEGKGLVQHCCHKKSWLSLLTDAE